MTVVAIDDDNSSWSEKDCIPAVEILNYDLNNVGLKQLFEPEDDKQGSLSIGTSSSSAGIVSNNKPDKMKVELTVAPKGERSKAVDDAAEFKVRYKIGYLPLPETDANEKQVIYEDHIHFLKHESIKSKSVKSNSIRNLLISPESIDGDEISITCQTHENVKFSIVDCEFASKHDEIESNMKTMSKNTNDKDLSEFSEDETPAIEILNYDLNNIGLKQLYQNEEIPARDGNQTKDTPSTDQCQMAEPAIGKCIENKDVDANAFDSDSNSELSEEDLVPAVEILNYDLINIGLKSLYIKEEEILERDSTVKDGNTGNVASLYSVQNDQDSEGNVSLGVCDQANDHVGTVDEEKNMFDVTSDDKHDDFTDESDDEIPAIEILNYDLNNVGLKQLYGGGEGTFMSSDVGSTTTEDDLMTSIANLNPNSTLIREGIKAPLHQDPLTLDESPELDCLDESSPASECKSCEAASETTVAIKNSCKSDNDGHQLTLSTTVSDESDSSDIEIPAVEILNYDLVNVCLRSRNDGSDILQPGLYPLINPVDINQISEVVQIHTSAAPLIANNDTCRTSLEDDSSAPGNHDFDDYGHFLSVAATVKQTSAKKTPYPLTDLTRELNTQEGEVIDNFCSPHTMREKETTTTTTIETRTKTFVEPDGTTVTTTTVTTRTKAFIPTNPDEVYVFKKKTDKSGTRSMEADAAEYSTTELNSTLNLSGDERTSQEPKASDGAKEIFNDTQEIACEDRECHSTSTYSDIEIKGGMANDEENVKGTLVDSYQSEMNVFLDGDVGHMLQSGTDVGTKHAGSNDECFPARDSFHETHSVEKLKYVATEVTTSTDRPLNLSDLPLGVEQNGWNTDTRTNRSQNFTKTKIDLTSTLHLFEDHGDFLNEAASIKSEADTKSILEEEKRNDETAKRKILSLGVLPQELCPVSPPTSPSSVPSKNPTFIETSACQ